MNNDYKKRKLLNFQQGVWNVSDKSNTYCEQIVSVNFHKDMFNYLSSSSLAPENLEQLQEIKQIFVQALLGSLHNVVQRAKTAREAFRASNAVDILQPFRLASDYQVMRPFHRFIALQVVFTCCQL
jgi:hypothetical protein